MPLLICALSMSLVINRRLLNCVHSKSLLLIQQTKITFQATVSLFKRDNLSRFIHIHQVLFISVKISENMSSCKSI